MRDPGNGRNYLLVQQKRQKSAVERSTFNRGGKKMLSWTQESKFGKKRGEENYAPFPWLGGCWLRYIFWQTVKKENESPLGRMVVIVDRAVGHGHTQSVWSQSPPCCGLGSKEFIRCHPEAHRGARTGGVCVSGKVAWASFPAPITPVLRHEVYS